MIDITPISYNVLCYALGVELIDSGGLSRFLEGKGKLYSKKKLTILVGFFRCVIDIVRGKKGEIMSDEYYLKRLK